MANIAILTSYPLVNPRHGGQIRANSISDKFRSGGWDVHTLAVFEEESHSQFKPWDIVFPTASSHRKFRGQDVLFITDLLTSKFVADEEIIRLVLSRLPADLDVIYVEQPWLWSLAPVYKERVNPHTILCYGSANIESELKLRILSSMTGVVYQSLLPEIIGEIEALERRATLEADVVACVSQSEYDTHRTWGAKRAVVAPNGVTRRAPTPAKVNEWRQRLGGVTFLTYIASAHPPNFIHFAEIVGGSLACFPPDAKLVVVGSVSEHIYHQSLKGPFAQTNQSRLELLFDLEPEDLDAVKELAHGFFLPIPYGGGTNLKTAEALVSEKFVIGTDAAFRGFEEYRNYPGVFVRNSPETIHEAVRRALAWDRLPATGPSRQALTWDYCLQPLIDILVAEVEAR